MLDDVIDTHKKGNWTEIRQETRREKRALTFDHTMQRIENTNRDDLWTTFETDNVCTIRLCLLF